MKKILLLSLLFSLSASAGPEEQEAYEKDKVMYPDIIPNQSVLYYIFDYTFYGIKKHPNLLKNEKIKTLTRNLILKSAKINALDVKLQLEPFDDFLTKSFFDQFIQEIDNISTSQQMKLTNEAKTKIEKNYADLRKFYEDFYNHFPKAELPTEFLIDRKKVESNPDWYQDTIGEIDVESRSEKKIFLRDAKRL